MMSKRQSTNVARRVPLSIVYLPIDPLKTDPNNARQHSAKQIRQIAKSIETFGFNVPVLIDAEGHVIAGHGRLLAAKRLGWTEIPTSRLEHLSETQKKAFMIADNRLAEVAVWDGRLLAEQLKALASVELAFDIETIGFDMGEIDLRIELLATKEAGVNEPAIPEVVGSRRARRRPDDESPPAASRGTSRSAPVRYRSDSKQIPLA